MKRLLSALACLLCAFCGAPPPIAISDAASLTEPLFKADSIGGFKGFGDVYLNVNGQRAKAKFDVQWRGDSDCLINVYTPLGGTLATLRADSLGLWTITQGPSSLKKLPTDRVALIDGAEAYPFSYAQFVSIIIGRLPDRRIFRLRPDSLVVDGKNAALFWRRDSACDRPYAITALINRKHSAITDVFYDANTHSPWRLTFSSLTDGSAKEIRFKDGHNNYFYLRYERIVSQKRAFALRKGP